MLAFRKLCWAGTRRRCCWFMRMMKEKFGFTPPIKQSKFTPPIKQSKFTPIKQSKFLMDMFSS